MLRYSLRLRSFSKVVGLASVCSVAAAYSEQQPRENVQDDGGTHGKKVWGKLKDRAMSFKSKDVETDLPMDKLACHRVASNAKSQAVVLVACGSFNPPTLAHLRVLELVRQEFFRQGIDVLGAYLSPVHNAYNKTALLPSEHRVSMCEYAAEGSDFIMVDSWESKQKEYKRTLFVLESIDRRIERQFSASDQMQEMPRTVLVCGGDMLESMNRPDIWDQDLLEKLLSEHGVACVSRNGSDLQKAVDTEGSLLNKYQSNILIVQNPIPNDISSSLVRQEVQQGNSVKYLVPDAVLEYIAHHGLYK